MYRSTCGRMAAAGCLAKAVVASALGEMIKQVYGPDLFMKPQLYAGRTIMLTDALVIVTGDDRAVIRAGGAIISVNVEDVDRESLRFFLTHCRVNSSGEECQGPFEF